MRIGIIGSGNMGATLGRLWARAGHQVLFSSRHPQTLGRLAEQVGHGARAGTVEEAVAFGEVLFLAVPYHAMTALARQLAPRVAGKVILDAGNAIASRDGEVARTLADSGEGTGARTQALLPEARVVKAFNTVHYVTLAARAGGDDDPVGVPLAGDDPDALALAETLVRDAGAEPVRTGTLAGSARLDFGSVVWNSNLGADELRRSLDLPEDARGARPRRRRRSPSGSR